MSTNICFMTGEECRKKIKPIPKRVFMAMPFKKRSFDNYRFAIKEYYQSEGFECVNVKESFFLQGEYVICKICQEIQRASLLVVDLSVENPNVSYELGIAHALKKKTIAIFKSASSQKRKKKDKRNKKDQINFLSKRSDKIIYKNIKDLKQRLSTKAVEFPLPEQKSERVERKTGYSVIALIPRKKKYSEVYEFGIKKSVRELEFPGDELINLDRKHVNNIIDDAMGSVGSLTEVLKNVQHARYCIVDITEKKNTEVFYWLGFIHGLRVNDNIDMRDDFTCLYVTNKGFAGLPFDVIAAKVIRYNSVQDLHIKVKQELEQLEVARIRNENIHKFTFWKKFRFDNTRFILGAADSLSPGETRARDRISIQDFLGYNRIIYKMLFIEPKKPFQYDMCALKLSEYIEKYEDLEGDFKEKKLEEMDPDKQEFDQDKLIKAFRKEGNEKDKELRDNYIVIGSCSVNPAAEKVMRALYGEKDAKGKDVKSKDAITFKTTHKYKARSLFWDYHSNEEKDELGSGEEKNKDRGLCISEKLIGRHSCDKNEKEKEDVAVDTALFIVCCGSIIGIKGNIILLSGFDKFGTFELCRVISRVNVECGDKNKSAHIDRYKKFYLSKKKDDHIDIEDFFSVLNDVMNGENDEEKKLNKSCCIEAVFEFFFKDDEDSHRKKNDIVLKHFSSRNIEKRERQDLIEKCKKIHKKNKEQTDTQK